MKPGTRCVALGLTLTMWIVGIGAGPVAALYSGDDQFDRRDLDSEKLLSPEYFLTRLSYRFFEAPALEPLVPSPVTRTSPMAWRDPETERKLRGFARASNGSVSSEQFLIDHEIGVRGYFQESGFWGYALRQQEDLEERFLSQRFELQGPIAGPLALRIFGEPTFKKQSSDLGLGAVLGRPGRFVQVDVTAVDMFYSKKNIDQRSDRRHPYSVLAKAVQTAGRDFLEASVEMDSPLEREFRDENALFNYAGAQAQLRGRRGRWSAQVGWEHKRISMDDLATLARSQDFNKQVVYGEVEARQNGEVHPGRAGLYLQRREAHFVGIPAGLGARDERRWEADPYVGVTWRLARKAFLDTTVYHALLWRRDLTAETRDFSLQARLCTALRWDFTPDLQLLLNPTWDLDEAFIGHPGNVFDGGNVQLEVRLF